MPVKLGSKLPPENEARIEIIPLIDIMFFLLAAFMLVSLSMVNLKGVKVNLPTATTATAVCWRGISRGFGGRHRTDLPRRPIGGERRARPRLSARPAGPPRAARAGQR